jgi:hypothetical protein
VKRAVKLAVIAALLATCYAQEPDAPSTTRRALQVATVAAFGFDAWATNRNLTVPNPYEQNPIAKPFVTHGTAERAGYFAACAGAFLLIDSKLNRHHKREARVFEFTELAVETWGASYSAVHHRSH